MRRLFRILFNTLTVLSLILFVATGVLWVRSYWVADTIVHVRPHRAIAVVVSKGEFVYQWHKMAKGTRIDDSRSGLHRTTSAAEPFTFPPAATFAGFGFYREDEYMFGKVAWTDYGLLLPLWGIAIATSLLPLWGIWRRFRPRDSTGLCPNCGYDLRATPDRCPECGAAASIANAGERKAAP